MPVAQAESTSLSTSSAVPAALLWGAIMLVAGGALGTLWYAVDTVWSPVILLPALVGGVLGVVGIVALEFAPTTSARWSALVLLLAGLTAALAFHYASYIGARDGFDRLREKLMSKDPVAGAVMVDRVNLPTTFVEYLGYEADQQGRNVHAFGQEQRLRGLWVYGMWLAEAVIVSIAAYMLVAPAVQRPFCPLCRTWRLTIRQGKTTADRAPWKRAATNAEGVANAELPNDDRPVAFNIQSCRCGAETSAGYSWNEGAMKRREMVSSDERAALLASLDRRPAKATEPAEPRSDASP